MTKARSEPGDNRGLCESCNDLATASQGQSTYPVMLGGGMGMGTMWLCPKCLAQHRTRDEEKKKVLEEEKAKDEFRNRSRALPPVRVIHPHVHHTKDDDSPIVEGSKVPVRRLYSWHRQGTSVETILRRYPELGPARVLDALAFAYDNLDLITADLARERAGFPFPSLECTCPVGWFLHDRGPIPIHHEACPKFQTSRQTRPIDPDPNPPTIEELAADRKRYSDG